ncbi:hypothetical protein NDU88_011593 [Pleurodeles waltl]|uniref:Uncharacterized protein n=1 Tax=Pleurodeles waltl TaxID=8319 RepID=A0AAV7S4Q0_PLEWA|nr:hypothetical protein NDU88_011593 [Pleurodeles waltl]
MPRTLGACSTDCCGRFTAFWRPPLGSGPQRQAPEGPARRCERGARPRPALLFLLTDNIGRLVGCVGRPDGAEVKQDPSLPTGTAEPRSRRKQKGPRIEGTQQSSSERGPA